ncbi:hypothetical protein ACKLNQ_17550 [Myroides odoratimimus]|uniref:hypothetical protein n=1 Tax=Myroides odoratimimus TaxID=76832 RepID=UPI0038D3E987
MKKYIIMCAALVGMSYFGQAQVGIGTKDPVKGSALEVQSTDKGVLLPRIPLASKTTLSPIDGNAADTKIKGLIVFNTNPNLDPADKGGSEGFYYWTGAAWTKLSSQEEIVKLIQENSSSSTEFVKEIVNVIVNEGTGSALKGTSVVLYDFEKKEFYTLVKDKDGNIVTSTPIDLGLKDVVRYKIVEGKTVLIYKDANGQDQTMDLNNLQIDTFIRDVKDKNGKVTGYLYFNENKVAEWIKANPKDAHRYKTDMPDTDGKLLDIVGDVANNLQEIFNSKKEVFETFVSEIKGNVTVKVESDRTYLIYNDGTKEVKIDLSQLETETFIRTIDKEVDGQRVVTGYVHFNESQISKWIKENPSLANVYKDQMKNTDGTYLDIVGAVSHNFKEIINNYKDLFQTIINESKGNVTIRVVDGKTVLVYKDDNGKEVILDLSAMEVVTFVRPILNDKNVATGYVYFNEQAIAKWLKDNPSLATIYQKEMPDSAGVVLDVVGAVTNNFEEIINKEGNKELITKVINNSNGNVTVKVDDKGKVVLVYKDESGKEQVIDLSSQEVDTFVKEIIENGKLKGYRYFSEAVIAQWQSENKDIASRYKTMMPDTLGTQIDVIGAVSQNFEEIINKEGNKELLTQIIQTTEGNVTIKVIDGKTVLVYKDASGEHVVDLNSLEVDTFVKEIKDASGKIKSYVYFGEAAISAWQKANKGIADRYKTEMTLADGGVAIDVVGAVSQNFEEIIKQGDNLTHLTEVIQKTEGNVSVEVKDGKTYLVYQEGNEKKTIDLSSQEIDTFIKEVKDASGKIKSYLYFSEAVISKWQSENKDIAGRYRTMMPDTLGTAIDVVGAVSQNFEEIIKQGDNLTHLTEVIQKTEGTVAVKEKDGKLVLVYVNDQGDKVDFDLSSQEVDTFVKEIKDASGKIKSYVYFGEAAISAWQKANKGIADRYKTEMTLADGGVTIDVVGAVSQNFEEIIKQGDNITHLTEVIQKTEGTVAVKEKDGKLVLVYVNDQGDKVDFDLSSQEVDTFVRLVPGKDSKGNDINLKYVYFGEAKIAAWIKANPTKIATYKVDMPESEGTVIDVLTDVTNNLGDIIQKSGDVFNNILNEHLTQGGTVYYGKIDGKTDDVLYSIVKDANGKEEKKLIDLSKTVKEILSTENNELITELKEAVSYDITDAIAETNIKFGGKAVSTFSSIATVELNDAEILGVEAPDGLGRADINVFDIKLYTNTGKLVTVGITDIKYNNRSGLLDFTLGSGDIYTPIAAGEYKVVVYFTK